MSQWETDVSFANLPPIEKWAEELSFRLADDELLVSSVNVGKLEAAPVDKSPLVCLVADGRVLLGFLRGGLAGGEE